MRPSPNGEGTKTSRSGDMVRSDPNVFRPDGVLRGRDSLERIANGHAYHQAPVPPFLPIGRPRGGGDPKRFPPKQIKKALQTVAKCQEALHRERPAAFGATTPRGNYHPSNEYGTC